MIDVYKKDDVNLKVRCEDRGIIKELSQFFTFSIPGAQYMPSYKNRRWDGKIKLFNMNTQELPVGLYEYLDKFCCDRGYEINGYDPRSKKEKVDKKHIKNFIDNYLKPVAGGEKISAHNHQIDAVKYVVDNDRCSLLSPTGSGKSLIIYSLVRYYLDMIPKDKKILIIVPTKSLVTQMYSDFKEYSEDNEWDVKNNCHTVMAGKNKIDLDKRVTISTWQSIYKLNKNYFANYYVAFGDECHLFKSKSLIAIMSKLVNCPYRVGTTGTLDGTKIHKLVIEGLFGPVYKVTSTKDLIKKDILSDIEIDCILLKYPVDFRNKHKRITYQEEIDLLVSCEDRNKFISNLTSKLKGNTLVLFQYVSKHGKPLYKMIKDMVGDRKCFFVYGDTHTKIREEVRKIVEKENDAIIVASYGTFSTGISIRRLHNIVFASPSKSRIRVLQSIGRQLRKSKYKEKAKLYDISDDICWKKYKNHTFRHYEERLKIYKSENFFHKTVVINIL